MASSALTFLNPLPLGTLTFTITDGFESVVRLSLPVDASVAHPVDPDAGPWVISATLLTASAASGVTTAAFTVTDPNAVITTSLVLSAAGSSAAVSIHSDNGDMPAGEPAASWQAPATAAPELPPTAQLPMTMQMQMQSCWAWAAVAASVAVYYNRTSTVTQCSLVNEAFGSTTCCIPVYAGTPACNQPYSTALALKMVSNLKQVYESGLTLSQIAAEISAGHPVVVRITWMGAIGHVLVITGYDLTAGTITVQDPAYGMAVLLFKQFPANYHGAQAWTNTCTTQAAPVLQNASP
jgi:hypothetical protein